MTLRNNLYDVLAYDVTLPDARFEILLREDCPIYAAHFPGMPITPGVCIVQMAAELLGLALRKNLRVTSVKNAKFLSALTPEAPVILVSITKIKAEGNSVTAIAEISDHNTKYAKISLQAEIA